MWKKLGKEKCLTGEGDFTKKLVVHFYIASDPQQLLYC